LEANIVTVRTSVIINIYYREQLQFQCCIIFNFKKFYMKDLTQFIGILTIFMNNANNKITTLLN